VNLAERQQLKARAPQVVVRDKHVTNCRIKPTRELMLDCMPKFARVAEIGVAFGDFSAEILKRCHVQKLTLIDLWGMERYSAGLERARQRFAAELEIGLVEIHRGYSVPTIQALSDSSLDWVYIDTNHSYETTHAELLACEQKLVTGGLIAGHDFCTGNVITPVPYGVIEAVNKFCVDRNWEYLYLTLEPHGHFSFCLRAISN
jgi:predicted O-methyltransferase YrrM